MTGEPRGFSRVTAGVSSYAIDQPLTGIGDAAFSQLYGIIEKQDFKARNILLDARLIRRQSA